MATVLGSLLPKGWYVILYHDVSWEENCYIRGLGGTCPPDIFRSHVDYCASLGRLVSIDEGMQALQSGPIQERLFSFWFDDGLIGVRKYAHPILREHGVTGAISICNRFVEREEFFWRFKLSYLNSIDGMRFVRHRLRSLGFKSGDSVRNFTNQHFSPEILSIIDAQFDRFTTPAQRHDAFRMFDDLDGLRQLRDTGWTIANHSAAHYPSLNENQEETQQLFRECDDYIRDKLELETNYWVFPFDQWSRAQLQGSIIDPGQKWLVLGSGLYNQQSSQVESRWLYRVGAPIHSTPYLRRAIIRAAARRKLKREVG